MIKLDKKKQLRDLNAFEETHINNKYQNISFTIILVQSENAGNIGSICRIMKNFDFKQLVIFNPIETIENIYSYETQGYAMHAKDILLDSEIIRVKNQNEYINQLKEYLKKFDLILGTTAKGSNYSNLDRLAIFPQDFQIPISIKPLKIAILYGRESRGLTNEEIQLTDIVLRIPASKVYPTLNLSHACGIIMYEIFKNLNIINIGRGKKPVLLADKEDKIILYQLVRKIIKKLRIRKYKKKKVIVAFKNIFERAMMSKKEVSLILGLFSKTYSILKELNLYNKAKNPK